jgi:thiamine-phosphate diphosphorylase
MSQTSELDTLAREIVRQHSHLALQANALDRLPMGLAALPTVLADPTGQAVYAACRALDFIDADAQCVARAWQQQTERTGQFDASAWPTEPQDFGLHALPVHEQVRHCERSEAIQDSQMHGLPRFARSDGDLVHHCEHSDGDLVRHCERSVAIQDSGLRGLPRRDAPRNDEVTAVIASEARQSRVPDFVDCHVADAPRNDESSDASADGFAPCPHQLGLYAVLPDAAWVGRMARAGVPTVQLRFKSNDPAAIKREVEAAVQAVQGTGALLFINDHWQAAIEAGAYGVHLGQEDLEGLGGADLNAIRAAGLRLGVSSHGYAEMLRAAAVNPSYIAMGAVYATTLKRMATPPQGPARLKMYAALLRDTPTVAIGGIDAARLPEVLASGVGSVAVVRALVAADAPEAQAAVLQAMFRR